MTSHKNVGWVRPEAVTHQDKQKLLPLGDVVEIVSGFGFPKGMQGKVHGELPFFKVGDISVAWNSGQKKLTQAQHYIDHPEASAIKARPFPKGTVVFAKIGEAIKLNRRAILGQLSIVDNNVMGLIPREGVVDQNYLFYWTLMLRLGDISQATTVPSVRKSDVEQLSFPWIPLDQQKRIVAEIEKQFSRLDEAIANLKRVKANLKHYKAAVLKAAVEGKLTEEWRKAHPDVKPADKLLKRILAERRAKWEELELAKMRAMGKEPKDDKWKSKYKEPTEPDITKLNQLPEGWLWVRLEQVTERITKGSSPNWQGFDYVEKGIPFVRSQNVLWGKLDIGTVAHLPKEFNEKEAKSVLQVGDVLLNIVGASIGRSAIVSEEVQGGNVNQAVAVIRLVSGGLRNTFLMYYLVSANAQDQINQEKVDVARANISLSDIADLAALLPPEKEQEKIMDEIARRLTITEKLELEIECNMKRAERLRQSILRKAFSGGLAVCQ
ncbi:MAG: restriction endonuclease subunit S [Thermodesulfobacteriota bacterium]